MWILILTFTTHVGGYGGAAGISQVGKFESEPACMAAAKAWLAQANTLYDTNAKALCVKDR